MTYCLELLTKIKQDTGLEALHFTRVLSFALVDFGWNHINTHRILKGIK